VRKTSPGTDGRMGAAMRDRALGSFVGLAIGDALGMPTQLMSRSQILADYGPITRLHDAGPHQVIATGMAAGSITDDTEQAILLARLLIAGDGHMDERAFSEALLAWESTMAAKGSLDLLGPSTKRAVERIAAGVPASEAGRDGTTNGAAMRIAPVGIATPPAPLEGLVDAVVAASRVTHNTSIGLGAAAAVGAAISVGVEGGSLDQCLAIGIEAADLAAERGNWVPGAHISDKTRWAVERLRSLDPHAWAGELDRVIGTDVPAQESVVAALAICSVVESPWEGVCLAASVGGDTDTIAAIVGAVMGARGGMEVWPREVVEQVDSVNGLDLAQHVDKLLELRMRNREVAPTPEVGRST
jgi:ADP-ribosylglycohydrolase